MAANGRPLKFKSPEELQEKAEEYFRSCAEPKVSGDAIYFEPITITGLALHLDTTRETLCDYAEKDGFSDTVKKLKMRVENFAEKHLYIGKSATGAIFALKNFGWSDNNSLDIGNKDNKPFQTQQIVDDNDKMVMEKFLQRAKEQFQS